MKGLLKLPKALSINDCRVTAPLTNAQTKLFDLMVQRIQAAKPLTFHDVSEIYFKYIVKAKKPNTYGGRGVPVIHNRKLCIYTLFRKPGAKRWTWDYLTMLEYKKTERFVLYCKQWFANNLGALIVKGKLLAIPIIDLTLKLEQ